MSNVKITDGNMVIRAVLNETVAAKEFKKRLPLKCNGYDTGTEYCCMTASGVFDPMELQTGWKNGDITLGEGWLVLNYAGEERSSSCHNTMVIGHIEKEDLINIASMPERVCLIITAEK